MHGKIWFLTALAAKVLQTKPVFQRNKNTASAVYIKNWGYIGNYSSMGKCSVQFVNSVKQMHLTVGKANLNTIDNFNS